MESRFSFRAGSGGRLHWSAPPSASNAQSALVYVSLVNATHLLDQSRRSPSASPGHLQMTAFPPASVTQTKALVPVCASSTRAVGAGRPRCCASASRVRRGSARNGRVRAYLVLVSGWFSFAVGILRVLARLGLFNGYSRSLRFGLSG